MIGKQLAHFRVEAKLGEGGMGEVYRATDTRLGREVALKVLPQAFVADPERVARFEREARVVASLNHPSIAAIHSFEQVDTAHLLVMELAEGEDLGQRIARGPMRLEEALSVARRIAEALEFAHDSGIVHRDLKPANVMVASDGTIKVLDFGLARAFADPSSGPGVELSASPTLTAQMTQKGVILGTAGYMSPEQARGEEVDKRADIWAFGVVLFEMLAGKRLFDGPSVTDVLAAVLRAEIDLDGLPTDVPGSIRRLLDRCLDRDGKTRLRDIGEARIRIARTLAGTDAPAEASPASGPAVAPSRGATRWIPWLVAALGIGASLVLGILSFKRSEVPRREGVVHTSIQLPDGVRLAGWSSPGVAFSPDGQTIAFVGHREGRQELYIRRLDEPEAIGVPDSDGAEGPFFSPDGRWVAFGSGAISGRSTAPSMLKRAPVAGGDTQRIAPLEDYFGGSWGSDGYIYYADAFLKDSLRRVRETGGEPEPLFADDRGREVAGILALWPQHVDGGRRLLLTANQTRGDTTMILDLETGELTDLGLVASFSRFSSSGHLVFAAPDGHLRVAPFDPAASHRVGASVTVVRDIALTNGGAPVFAVGESGDAIYATGFVRGSDRVLSRLVRIDASDGSVERLPFEPDTFNRGSSLAPDGRRLAATTSDGTLWIYDLARGTRLKVPDGEVAGRKYYPLWSPDGTTIVYTVADPDRGGRHLYALAADGTGTARLLAGEPGEAYASDWTADGREVIYSDYTGTFRVAVSGDEPAVLVNRIPEIIRATLSPDGRWLAYQSSETGRTEVYLEPYPEGGAVIPVSSGGGQNPEWSPRGDELFYNQDCDFFAVEVRLGPPIELGGTRHLFEHCDPTRRRGAAFEIDDEGRFYVLEAVPDSGVVTALELVLNWTERISAALGG